MNIVEIKNGQKNNIKKQNIIKNFNDNLSLINKMIQTIVLIQNGKYPFGEVIMNKKSIKVQDIRSYNTIQRLRQQKIKMQNIFNSCDKSSQTTVSQDQNQNIIKLTKIYQQDLTLHFIFQYIPYSLTQFIKNKLLPDNDRQKLEIFQMNTKLFIKKVLHQLGYIVNFLVKRKIKTNLDFDLLGIDQQQNLKFFISAGCQILYSQVKSKDDKSLSSQSNLIQNQLLDFYQSKKQAILFKLEAQFKKLKKNQQSFPNFVIQGNRLVFSQPLIQVQSQCFTPTYTPNYTPCHSPCYTSFSQSSFTDRCQAFDNQFLQFPPPNDNIRTSHGNLFTKLKKSQSYNFNSQSNKKLQQNLVKLQNLRKKSKKLNDQLKQSYLSSSQCFPPNTASKDQTQFNRRGSTQFQQTFGQRVQTQRQDDDEWRNSQIPQKLRKTHLPKGNSAKSPNRFGLNNFDGKRSKSTKNHKSSFQFKPQKQRDWFNPNKSFDKGFKDDFDSQFQQSRSIRIQVEQKQTKQRKSSFKVKILTCQQMQMDGDNLQEFVFNTMNKNFNHKKNQDNNEEEGYSDNSSQCGKKSNRSKSSKYSQRFKNVFTQKFKNDQEVNTKFSESPVKEHIRQKQRQTSNHKNIFQKYHQQFGNEKQKSSKNPLLEQKIKLAKQKAQNVLNQYMKNKKFSSKNSNSSKYGY